VPVTRPHFVPKTSAFVFARRGGERPPKLSVMEGIEDLPLHGGHFSDRLGFYDKQARKAMSDEELKSELERLRNENAALKKGASTGVRLKVSEKGAVSIYGMGRFPVTLYKEQWLKLLDMAADIRAFIVANEAQLKAKD
jgi:hypothetical protein